MLSKIKTLAAAIHLEKFTVEALARRASVPLESARTVVSRCNPDWFSVTTVPTGGRGGQPNQYELTDLGRKSIETELGRLPDLPKLAPVPQRESEPLGLLRARASLEKVAVAGVFSPGEHRHISRDLDWAHDVLTGSEPPAGAKQYLEQIAASRARLEELSGNLKRAVESVAAEQGASESNAVMARSVVISELEK